MKILIPGGLGYIGSHMVEFLKDRNHEVVILDNLREMSGPLLDAR